MQLWNEMKEMMIRFKKNWIKKVKLNEPFKFQIGELNFKNLIFIFYKALHPLKT